MGQDSTIDNSRLAFGYKGLSQAVAEINQSFPEELGIDWQSFVRHQFKLTPDQEESLNNVPPNLVKEFQDYFIQASTHVKKGGAIHANIIELPPEQQTPQAFHEVHVSLESKEVIPQLSFVIAHCDANCQNWGWGPG